MRSRRFPWYALPTVMLALCGFAVAQPPATEAGYLEVAPGVRLYVERFGEGVPTVFVPARREAIDLIAPLLYLHDVLTWDPREGGVDVQIHDAEALRKHVGADGVTFIGHGAWGAVGLAYAARHPERVARLVLITPATAQGALTVAGDPVAVAQVSQPVLHLWSDPVGARTLAGNGHANLSVRLSDSDLLLPLLHTFLRGGWPHGAP